MISDIPKEPKSGKSFVGGPRVGFADDIGQEEDEKEGFGRGNFERHDTPHPKHPHPKGDRKLIDGHVIHHETAVRITLFEMIELYPLWSSG